MNNKPKIISVLFFIMGLIPAALHSQCLWASIELDANIAKNIGAFAEGEFRSYDQLSGTDRWSGTIGIDYKPISYMKLSAGYTGMEERIKTEITRKGNIIPSYWQPRHRAFFTVTGSYKIGRIELSLRERYQYTYRPKQYVTKYDSDGITRKTDEIIKTKHQHVLRSRLQVEYNIRKCKFTPYASCEIYNSLTDGFSTEKTRWTAGTSYKLNKKNSLSLYYRYIDETDEDEDNGHIIGIGYKHKF